MAFSRSSFSMHFTKMSIRRSARIPCTVSSSLLPRPTSAFVHPSRIRLPSSVVTGTVAAQTIATPPRPHRDLNLTVVPSSLAISQSIRPRSESLKSSLNTELSSPSISWQSHPLTVSSIIHATRPSLTLTHLQRMLTTPSPSLNTLSKQRQREPLPVTCVVLLMPVKLASLLTSTIEPADVRRSHYSC